MAVISWINNADSATIEPNAITEANGSATLPLTNMQNRQIGSVFRYDATGMTVGQFGFVLDFGSAVTHKLIYLINHNLPAGTYTVKFGTTSEGSEVGTETGTLWVGSGGDSPNSILYSGAGYSSRYVSVFLDHRTGTSSPESHIVDIGRIWVSDTFSTNVSMNFSTAIKDRSTVKKSRGGSTYARSRPILRVMNLAAIGRSTADFVGTSADFDSFLSMDLNAGTHGEVVCLPLTDTTHNMNRLGIYGTITNNGAIEVVDKGSAGFLTTKRFTIEEDRAT